MGGVNWILVGGGIKVWWGGGGGSLWGVGIFLGGKGMSKFFSGGGTPGYDLTLIKKRHINFLFAFTEVLIKNKNSLLVTAAAQFTAKTTNSEKSYLFLSFMP